MVKATQTRPCQLMLCRMCYRSLSFPASHSVCNSSEWSYDKTTKDKPNLLLDIGWEQILALKGAKSTATLREAECEHASASSFQRSLLCLVIASAYSPPRMITSFDRPTMRT